MSQSAAVEPLVLPASVREASGHFLNWIYNDVFHSPTGVLRLAVKDFVALPGFGTGVRIFYEWSTAVDGFELTLGVLGDQPREAWQSAATDRDRPPFSLLMSVWLLLCHRVGALSEGELIDMEAPLERVRAAERVVYTGGGE